MMYGYGWLGGEKKGGLVNIHINPKNNPFKLKI